MKDIENIIKNIEDLLKESEASSENAAPGYDEGWFCGEINAYNKVLDIMKEVLKDKEEVKEVILSVTDEYKADEYEYNNDFIKIKVDLMKETLKDLSDGTNFDFEISEVRNREVFLYMQGHNPCNEDWCTELIIAESKTKNELIKALYEEIQELYDNFDIEEETYLKLEAKRNGLRGIPGVVDLVHNEEYKKNALKEFAEKLEEIITYRELCYEPNSQFTNANEFISTVPDYEEIEL